MLRTCDPAILKHEVEIVIAGIIQQWGGKVESRWRPGTEALFAGSSGGPPSDGSLPTNNGGSSDSSREPPAATVLVVEDQEQVLRVTERALTRSGFTVLATGSSEEALKLLDAGEKVDVLLSDVVMPKVSGLELARRARELRPSLKIVFMSGYSGGPLIEQVRALRGVTTLEKPFRPSDLVACVRQVLESE